MGEAQDIACQPKLAPCPMLLPRREREREESRGKEQLTANNCMLCDGFDDAHNADIRGEWMIPANGLFIEK